MIKYFYLTHKWDPGLEWAWDEGVLHISPKSRTVALPTLSFGGGGLTPFAEVQLAYYTAPDDWIIFKLKLSKYKYNNTVMIIKLDKIS